MAVTEPNVFNFRSQWPEFDTDEVSDADITNWLNTAKMFVDQTMWSEADWPLAVLCMAAHLLTYSQSQIAGAELGGTLDLFPRSIGFGERRVMYGERRAFNQGKSFPAPGEEMLSTTPYGAMYLQLRYRNFPAVAVV